LIVLRKERDQAWTMTGFHGVEHSNVHQQPLKNPMWKTRLNDIKIFKSVQQLFSTLGQSHAKLDLDRHNSNSSVQALVVTSVPYNTKSTN